MACKTGGVSESEVTRQWKAEKKLKMAMARLSHGKKRKLNWFGKSEA